jgi:hypothetical protein
MVDIPREPVRGEAAKPDWPTINWTADMLKRLKAAHHKAVSSRADQFTISIRDTRYAKYLIEYLEPKFKGQ